MTRLVAGRWHRSGGRRSCSARRANADPVGEVSGSRWDLRTPWITRLYFAGDRVDGFPLVAILSRDDTAQFVSFVYGDCDPRDDLGVCATGEVQVWPACRRNLALYEDASASGGSAGADHCARSARRARRRHATRARDRGATVVVFGDSRERVLRLPARCGRSTGAPRGAQSHCRASAGAHRAGAMRVRPDPARPTAPRGKIGPWRRCAPCEARARARAGPRRASRYPHRARTRFSFGSRPRASAAPTCTSNAGTSGRPSAPIRPSRSGTSSAARWSRSANSVHDVSEGDTSSAESHVTCGVCFHCRTGRAHMCERTQILDVDRDGGFADYVRGLPASVIWRNDRAKLPPHLACLQEPFGNAVFATSTQDLAGRAIAVLGCGPVGSSRSPSRGRSARGDCSRPTTSPTGWSSRSSSARTPSSTSARWTTFRRGSRAERGRRHRRRLRDVRRAEGDRGRVRDRPSRRQRGPVRDPGTARDDRHRRIADLQEPHGERRERSRRSGRPGTRPAGCSSTASSISSPDNRPHAARALRRGVELLESGHACKIVLEPNGAAP